MANYVCNVDRGEWKAVPDWIAFLLFGTLLGFSGLVGWGLWFLIHHHGGR